MFKNKKSIPLDQFINKALYDKSSGYYFKKNPFGKNGDYITSPNISRLFSEMLSIWTISFWGRMLWTAWPSAQGRLARGPTECAT